ncbi:MAG: hypothetical protein ACOCXG_04510 [Nanoarchaeota archaeon]
MAKYKKKNIFSKQKSFENYKKNYASKPIKELGRMERSAMASALGKLKVARKANREIGKKVRFAKSRKSKV